MSWKNIIGTSNNQLKETTDILNKKVEIINNAFDEIIKFDILQLKKIKYDLFKDVQINKTNIFYKYYCKPHINRYVNDKMKIYLNALKEYTKNDFKIKFDESSIYLYSENEKSIELILNKGKLNDIAYNLFEENFL